MTLLPWECQELCEALGTVTTQHAAKSIPFPFWMSFLMILKSRRALPWLTST